jgi:hypothetical protein
MIINGNQKDKFRRKHIVKITFRKKECKDLLFAPSMGCDSGQGFFLKERFQSTSK